MEPERKRRRTVNDNVPLAFHVLPQEMVFLVATFLRPLDLANLSRISSLFREMFACTVINLKNESFAHLRFRVRMPSTILLQKMMLLAEKFNLPYLPIKIVSGAMLLETCDARRRCFLRVEIPCDTWINAVHAQQSDDAAPRYLLSIYNQCGGFLSDYPNEGIITLSQPVSGPHMDLVRLDVCRDSGRMLRGILVDCYRGDAGENFVDCYRGDAGENFVPFIFPFDHEFVTLVGWIRHIVTPMQKNNQSMLKITLSVVIENNAVLCVKWRFTACPWRNDKDLQTGPILWHEVGCDAENIEVMPEVSPMGCRTVIDMVERNTDPAFAKIWHPQPFEAVASYEVENIHPFICSFDDDEPIKLRFNSGGRLMLECRSDDAPDGYAHVVTCGQII